MILLKILFFINLFFLVKDDYKDREVHLWQLFTLVLLSFSFINSYEETYLAEKLIFGFVTVGILFMIRFLVENYIVYIKSRFVEVDIKNLIVIGEGDYPLFFVIGIMFEFQEIFLCFLLTGIFALIHHFIYKKIKADPVPLIPSIAYSIICVLLMKYCLNFNLLINL